MEAQEANWESEINDEKKEKKEKKILLKELYKKMKEDPLIEQELEKKLSENKGWGRKIDNWTQETCLIMNRFIQPIAIMFMVIFFFQIIIIMAQEGVERQFSWRIKSIMNVIELSKSMMFNGSSLICPWVESQNFSLCPYLRSINVTF